LVFSGVDVKVSFEKLQELATKRCRELWKHLHGVDFYDLSDEGMFLLARSTGADRVEAILRTYHDYILLELAFRFLEEDNVIVCKADFSVEKLNANVRRGNTRISVKTEKLLRVSCAPEA
jgi:hypothetical protein